LSLLALGLWSPRRADCGSELRRARSGKVIGRASATAAAPDESGKAATPPR
jgi:hypothetical protein